MQLFPFSYSETIAPHNLEQFKLELKKITVEKRDHERARTKFYGQLNEEGFLIEPKLNYKNFWRPSIKGIYDYDRNNIRVKLDVPKRCFIILGVWLGMLFIGILTSDAENKIFFGSLISIVITVFWYIAGYIFYSIDIEKTKKTIGILKNMAEQDDY
ncbi:MAG: hypothetical protein ACI8ZM_001201 [Crocinitomix sp.]|jgi:hypothetical protein